MSTSPRTQGGPTQRLLVHQGYVLIGSRVGVAPDQSEPRLADPRPGAVQECELPEGRIDRPVVNDLLDLVQSCLALLCVDLGALLLERCVEVGVAAVDVGATFRDVGLDAACRVAEGAARALDDILEALLGVTLEERGPLQRPQLGADANGLQVVERCL